MMLAHVTLLVSVPIQFFRTTNHYSMVKALWMASLVLTYVEIAVEISDHTNIWRIGGKKRRWPARNPAPRKVPRSIEIEAPAPQPSKKKEGEVEEQNDGELDNVILHHFQQW